MDGVNEDLRGSHMIGYLQENHNFDIIARMNSFHYLESTLAFLKKDIDRTELKIIETQEKFMEIENINQSTQGEITSLTESMELKRKNYESIKSSLKQEYSSPNPNFVATGNLEKKTQPSGLLSKSNFVTELKKLSLKYTPFTWKIEELSKKRNEAKAGTDTMIKSDPFYTYPEGFKLRLVLYPNGVGSGANTHLSLGFQILKGEYDDTLKWPMEVGMILSLTDNTLGGLLYSKCFKLEIGANTTRYMRPTTEMNAPIGKPKYIKFVDLCNESLYHEMYSNDSISIVATLNFVHHMYEVDNLQTRSDMAN